MEQGPVAVGAAVPSPPMTPAVTRSVTRVSPGEVEAATNWARPDEEIDTDT